ncbi:TPA: hypothetical protein ACNVWL_005261 [Pseudomonas aeruginosa]
MISLLRKGEALPGHQEEAADEIERLRDWNDHLNNTVLPNILNPNFLMLMKGGERLLDLCTKDGKFIGVSLNDMKDVFDWMVTHARIAPDHAALAQPSPAQAEQPTADDYEEVLADHRRLVRELDVLLNGEEGAAKQASLCDLVGQVSAIVRERRVPLLSPSQAEAEQHERLLSEACASALNQRDAALAKIAELDQALAEKDPFGAKLNRISEKLERCDALLVARAAQAGQVPQAWLDVQAERRRQIEAEGWTPEHDDAHSHGEMARAAACYALAGSSAPNDGTAALLVSLAWPWDEQWWKPTTTRRDLVKACALGLAEIERLDRAASSEGGPHDA